jgi:hypothetical protein
MVGPDGSRCGQVMERGVLTDWGRGRSYLCRVSKMGLVASKYVSLIQSEEWRVSTNH